MIFESKPLPVLGVARRAFLKRLPAATLGLAVLAAGCGGDELPNSLKQGVALEEVPPPVMAAAKKTLPGVTFIDAWKNIGRDTGKLHSYEIRGKAANGKTREVRVSTTGAILETE